MATPWVTPVELLSCMTLLPLARSNTCTPPPCLSEATSRRPSGVTARLYGPRPVANRRPTAHRSRSTSTISSALLHATYTWRPSTLGCAQVGEQVAFGIAWPAPCAGADVATAAPPIAWP